MTVKKNKNKTIGEIIAEARKKSGLSLRAVAGRIPIAFSYLRDIEKGKTIPSEKVIRALSEQSELELDFDYMMAHSGRLGEEVEDYLKEYPAFGKAIRNIAKRKLKEPQLENLNQFINEMEQ